MSASRDALDNLMVHFNQDAGADDTVTLQGQMRFGKALEGPPGRLHGGYHAHVRTLPILERCSLHDPAQTYPCALDVDIRQALALDDDVAFDASYTRRDSGWELQTRFSGTERLRATVRSLPAGPLLSQAELDRYRALYEASLPAEGQFKMFAVTVQLGAKVVFLEGRDPLHTQPESQLADLLVLVAQYWR